VAAEHDDRRAAQTVREVAREVLTCAPADAVGAEEPSHAAHLTGGVGAATCRDRDGSLTR
jgi:hypothetical protein